MMSFEKELDVLEKIYRSQNNIKQRDLARIIGLSLGMTNSILKRLVQKGLLQIKKVNNRNIQYIVSSQGIEEIASRSYRYFRRTIKNVVYYKESLNNFARELLHQGFEGIILIGNSDLDFIVEHVCYKNKLIFQRCDSIEKVNADDGKYQDLFILFSETDISQSLQQSPEKSAHLQKILTKN